MSQSSLSAQRWRRLCYSTHGAEVAARGNIAHLVARYGEGFGGGAALGRLLVPPRRVRIDKLARDLARPLVHQALPPTHVRALKGLTPRQVLRGL